MKGNKKRVTTTPPGIPIISNRDFLENLIAMRRRMVEGWQEKAIF